MNDTQPLPPRLASMALRPFLRAADAEAVPGDLLEEYREVRRPALGQAGANRWYIRQVVSIIWHVMWPCLLAVCALRVASFPLPRGWNPSVVQAPGVSLLDALLFAAIGYNGWRRGGLTSAVTMSGLTGLAGVAIFFLYAALRMPELLAAPFEKPFIFVIMLTFLAIAETFAIAAGALGALLGYWNGPVRRASAS